jgi:DNA-binding GntR family transcriptional regulator
LRISNIKIDGSLRLAHLSLSDRVYAELRRLLVGHYLEPGEKISLLDVAERLEVSLTPLREALARLREEGLVSHRTNRGYFVAEVTPEEVQHLIEMRQALEGFALQVGLPRMSDDDLRAVAAAVEAYGAGLDARDRDRFLHDKQLHLRLAACAGNPLLSSALEQVLDRMIMKLRVEELPRERGLSAHQEHQRLLDAVRRRDAETARQLLWAHLEHTKRYILQYLRERRSWPPGAAAGPATA